MKQFTIVCGKEQLMLASTLPGTTILRVNEKLPVLKTLYLGKYTIQLDGYFCNHVSGQRWTGLEKIPVPRALELSCT